jgi:hypothetical protein
MSAVYQHLPCHMHTSRSRLGPSQCHPEEGRVPLRIYPTFCNKRNIIPEFEDKFIIMFFKKGLRDSSLIRKLTMKNPRMSEEMLAIANNYTLAEEETLDTREQKKEKESGHMDQPSSPKGHDKKRKVDHSINNVERPRHNKEYQPRPGEFEDFLDHIYIFHPREST